MTTTTAVPSSDVSDFVFNVETLDRVVNSLLTEYTDRLGVVRKTLAGAVASISAINIRGAWTTATTYQPRDVVSNSGSWYIALDTHTSGATFAGDTSAHWRVYQGILASDLANAVNALLGSGAVAHTRAVAYGAGTVGGEINYLYPRVDRSAHPSLTNVIVGGGAATDAALTGTVGYRNTLAGVGAGAAISTATSAGGSNCYYGFGSGAGNKEGSGNCYYGALTATANVNGDHNNCFGYRALDKHTASIQNNVFGFEGLFSLTSGNNNCGFGESVLYSLASGNGNCGFGMLALYSKTGGDFTSAFGYNAGFSETTAVGNSYFGYKAGFSTTTSGGNTIGGYESASTAAAGINNTTWGYQAAKDINGGTYNVSVGWQSHLRLSSGGSNTAVGQQSGNFITTGNENVTIGPSAGAGISTASQCVAVGSGTLGNINGAQNTAVGFAAGAPGAAQTWTNTTSLGAGANPTGSNQVTLGNASVTTIRAQVTTITAISDARDKKDIQPLADLLPDGFLDDVEAVAYKWAMRDGTNRGDALHAGVIAQQLQAVQERYGLQWLKLVDESNPDRLEATPGNLLMPLVVSVQRQRKLIANLAARVEALEATRVSY